FARRFATYKRAALLFSDEARLAALLSSVDRPVQIVIAGKAHPADRPGQQVIQRIFELSRSNSLRGRVFVIEDYDVRIARFLVGGIDLWLNNPRRPMEASGTSGMKGAINGIPSVSILDGWWDEGFTGDNGWAIGDREPDGDEAAQDAADAAELYRLLEEEIVPRFFDRDADGVPHGWLTTMRAAIGTALWQFSTARMLSEYVDHLYLPAVREPVRA
ncbi:MAG: alpha-glucan family phosphorylase, partial [Candidatus Limnocylindria bacterium]